MLCSKCRFNNTADANFCLICGTSLLTTAPAGNNTDHFDGYVPEWLAGTPATVVSEDNASSYEPISIEGLLTSSVATFVQPNFSSSRFSTSNTTPPPPFTVEAAPLLLGAAATATDYVQSVPPVNVYHPPDGSHISGVYKGCLYYPDGFGQTIVVPLAGFWVRFKAAALDYFVSAFFSVVFWVFAGFLIGKLEVIMNWAGMDTTPVSVSQNFSTMDSILIQIFNFSYNEVIPFLYYVLMIGLTGQTLGMRWCEIRVIKKNDRSIGVFSAIIRALWGIVYFAIVLFTSIFAASQLSNTPVIAGEYFLLFMLLFGFVAVALVIILMLIDKGKQAMNDKLAGTYVVSITELTRF